MAQTNITSWNYLAGSGTMFKLELHHNPITGDVLVMLDGNIFLADRGVKENRDLHFFLNEEFCELHITRKAAYTYEYKFSLDRSTPTPLNVQRRRDNSVIRYAQIAGGAFMFLFLVFVVYNYRFGKVATHNEITALPPTEDYTINLSIDSTDLAEVGRTVATVCGQEVNVRHEAAAETRAECLYETAMHERSQRGIADVNNRHTLERDDTAHNRTTYLALLSSEPFQYYYCGCLRSHESESK